MKVEETFTTTKLKMSGGERQLQKIQAESKWS